MMRWQQSDPRYPINLRRLVGVLIVGQVWLGGYLLALDGLTSLVMAVLCGIPFALLLNAWLLTDSPHRHLRMAALMFASGGFAMMLGCAADLGRTGLLELLAHCQSMPLPLLPDPLIIWQKMRMTPWTYAGMFIGGNLGMLLLREFRPGAGQPAIRLAVHYVVCNAGMLLGMLASEAVVARLVVDGINQMLAAGAMFTLMTAGMTLGMVAMLAVVERWPRRLAAAA